MKYTNGKLHIRKIGEPRVDRYSKYLGGEKWREWELQGKNIIFVGTEKINLDLTIGGTYKIIKVKGDEYLFDRDIQNMKTKKEKEYAQHHGRVIVLINNKGKKRGYYENLFILSEKQDEIQIDNPNKKESFKLEINVGDIIIGIKGSSGSGSYRRGFNNKAPHTVTNKNENNYELDNGRANVYINPSSNCVRVLKRNNMLSIKSNINKGSDK